MNSRALRGSSDPDPDYIANLATKLSQLSTTEEKLAAVSANLRAQPVVPIAGLRSGGGNASDPLAVRAATGGGQSAQFAELLGRHGLMPGFLETVMKSAAERVKVLERAPCAHVVPDMKWACPKEGKLACSKCKLVGYCSKDCQSKHWKVHKSDCNDPIRSPSWAPAWVEEGRPPAFMGGEQARTDRFWFLKKERLAFGMHLWGNIPAMDILKLSHNEGMTNQDFSLAFVASGDIRNLVRTVNGLPADYSGELNILLNDREPIIVLRNIVLLQLLGTIPDHTRAAEIALHYWYSAFVPFEYNLQMQTAMRELIEQMGKDMSLFSALGSRGTLSGEIVPEVLASLISMIKAPYQIGDASNELHRVRFAPSRRDFLHRHYCRLEPSHRLAFLEFRRFGLVLPFGAENGHFNTPNRLLFSPSCEWLQTDHANPLDSWEIPAVLDAGKAHGAQRADIYGCLYFYLSEQLREFAERLGRFRINVQMFSKDASVLSEEIRSGALAPSGVSPTRRFDRIEVSNILDAEYVGIPQVLSDWGPLLSESEHATLVGYCMNWPARQEGADINTADPGLVKKLMKRVEEKNAISRPSRTDSISDVMRKTAIAMSHTSSMNALYDNSKAFEKYLAVHGVAEALRRTGLKLKEKHTIVPHRLLAPLDGPPSALPVFPDKESWYLNVGVGISPWTERFLEVART
ncbi:hypothetical protein BOTBODRAFT_463500 [Botryobasidium botryosum FD-172 SS1]|uniref:MYND-type domain-containing protein n=1 Tax=Botryobasidium botryosum (strain FD-172 SS1) TaxID=930990 RepID=A0A067M6R8_BOTB1|nr:hypothetical protein BOTBODRAFT_463500 [Botryobasidium botryosum FD-172 SS1]